MYLTGPKGPGFLGRINFRVTIHHISGAEGIKNSDSSVSMSIRPDQRPSFESYRLGYRLSIACGIQQIDFHWIFTNKQLPGLQAVVDPLTTYLI